MHSARLRERGAVQTRIAGLAIEFRCADRRVTESIAIVLRHHVVDTPCEANVCRSVVVITIEEGSPVPNGRLVMRGDPSRGMPWVWALSPRVACELPNRLYYWLVLPLLTRILGAAGHVRVHGAVLWSEWSQTVLLFGASGAGKSTAAAGWGAGGGMVIAEDTAFLHAEGGLRVSGLHTPFHLGPQAVASLPMLARLDSAVEYLPGRSKVEYDWWAMQADRVLEHAAAPRHVIVGSVGTGAVTLVRSLDAAQIDAVFHEATSPDGASVHAPPRAVLRCLAELSGAAFSEVVWGADVLRHPLRHLGILRPLLADFGIDLVRTTARREIG